MSGTQTVNEQATQPPTTATVDLKLEVIIIPVSDDDRAKRFYESLVPKHHRSQWYAAYIVARERGETSEDAVKEAARHIEGATR